MKITENEDDFYGESVDILSIGKSREVSFGTKTPVLVLPQELYTQNRRAYHESLSQAIERGKLLARYLFGIDTTVEALTKVLKNLRNKNGLNQRELKEHMIRLKDLLTYRNLDLRFCLSAKITSCLLAEKMGMVHHKNPGTTDTKYVEFIYDQKNKVHKELFDYQFGTSTKLDEHRLLGILMQAELRYGLREWKQKALEVPEMRESKDSERAGIARGIAEIISAHSMGVAKQEEIKEIIRKYASMFEIPKPRIDYLQRMFVELFLEEVILPMIVKPEDLEVKKRVWIDLLMGRSKRNSVEKLTLKEDMLAEVDDPNLLFDNRIEVGIREGIPYGRIDNMKLSALRTQERHFARLSLLVGARHVGEGWIHKVEDLMDERPGYHGYHDLHGLLDIIGLKHILKSSGRRDGMVRLALERTNCILERSITMFRSLHMKKVRRYLDSIRNPWPALDLDDMRARLFDETLQLWRNTSLIKKAAELLGWTLEDIEWKELVVEACGELGSYLKAPKMQRLIESMTIEG